MPDQQRYVIAHHNDNDGRCAAALFVLAHSLDVNDSAQCVFVEVGYGQPLPPELQAISANDVLVILDFSFPLETMMELKEKVGYLIWFDHHATATPVAEWMRGRDSSYVVFDTSRSGAQLVYDDYFVKYTDGRSDPFMDNADKVVAWVNDRDLFKNEIQSSADFFNGTVNYDWKSTCSSKIEFWIRLLVDKQFAEEVLAIGSAFTYQTQSLCDMVVKKKMYRKTIWTLPDGSTYKVAWYNRASNHTDIGAAIYTAEPDIDFTVGFNIKDNGFVFLAARASAEKVKGGINTGAIMKSLYGGGGHPGASGAELNVHAGMSLIIEVYTSHPVI